LRPETIYQHHRPKANSFHIQGIPGEFLSDKKLTSDEYSSANGAPEKLFVHVEALKK
jgi:hypothetical protein